jgi:hypothetical protein
MVNHGTLEVKDIEETVRNLLYNSNKHQGEIWSHEYRTGYKQALHDLVADLTLNIEEE